MLDKKMAEKRFRIKIAFNLALIILGSVIIALFLRQMGLQKRSRIGFDVRFASFDLRKQRQQLFR